MTALQTSKSLQLHSLNTIYNTTGPNNNYMLSPPHVLWFPLDEQSYGPVLRAYGLIAPALLGFFHIALATNRKPHPVV